MQTESSSDYINCQHHSSPSIQYNHYNELNFNFNIQNNSYTFSSLSDSGELSDIFQDKKEMNNSLTSPSSHIKTKIHKNKMLKTLEEQKQIKKLRNKESARRSRAKKKKEFARIFQENQLLKRENLFLKSNIHSIVCKSCKDKLTETLKNTDIINSVSIPPQPLNNQEQSNVVIRSNHPPYSENKKHVTLFTTFIVLLCLFGSVIDKANNYVNKSPIQQKLSTIRTLDSFELNLEQLNISNFTIGGWFITFSDYYAVTKKHPFLEHTKYKFENKGKIRIIKENDAAFYTNTTCENCIIKLKDETIVSDGKSLSFSLIVPKRNFYSEDVASEGIYYNEKSTEEELCYEIKCEVIGVKTLKLQPD